MLVETPPPQSNFGSMSSGNISMAATHRSAIISVKIESDFLQNSLNNRFYWASAWTQKYLWITVNENKDQQPHFHSTLPSK